MKSGRKILLTVAVTTVAILAFLTWYRVHFSMDVASAYEVNDPGSGARVLIATQGSAFKDAVVAGVVARLKARPAYVKVIDVTELTGVNARDWNAVVVIHTWEMRRPQLDARAFVDRSGGSRNVVVLSTSGAGDFKMEGVDAISSASTMEDVPARVAEIGGRIDAILEATPQG